eukprot:TRINITY_DN74028_c0_g1_i1.p3 TRINITY_DN74028_c0_g1~~TRINITY_DN74028_c0_g1_i1.p3  ORF type:complete len:125 (+),score=20.08 TRINITY_DN74028_c0_g1_i1:108-482(+)
MRSDESKLLACHFVDVSLGLPSEKRQASKQQIAYFLVVVMVVGEIFAASGKLSIGRAKQSLRSHGAFGTKLASRVSGLGTARITLAHPDCALTRNIIASAAQVSSSGSAPDSSGVDGVHDWRSC